MKQPIGNSLLKKAGFYTLFLAYFTGGINHFVQPEIYLPLIPPYLVYIKELNLLSGLAEVVLAIGALFHVTRKLAIYGIILMLLAFLPTHVYFIEMGSCISKSICFDPWVAWVRLIVIHPILIYWAYIYRNYDVK
ncbi:MAG: putative membrane protein [Vicingaceae bacterium]|jgi:uncharacterized membrane protein